MIRLLVVLLVAGLVAYSFRGNPGDPRRKPWSTWIVAILVLLLIASIIWFVSWAYF